MEALLNLNNKLQRACTNLGDFGHDHESSLPTLWDSLPTIAVVGGQVYICFRRKILFIYMIVY